MRDRSSIKFELPVPWAAAPAYIEASGRLAVIVAGIVAVLIVVVVGVR